MSRSGRACPRVADRQSGAVAGCGERGSRTGSHGLRLARSGCGSRVRSDLRNRRRRRESTRALPVVASKQRMAENRRAHSAAPSPLPPSSSSSSDAASTHRSTPAITVYPEFSPDAPGSSATGAWLSFSSNCLAYSLAYPSFCSHIVRFHVPHPS